MDWSTTRAFAHPAENQGYIRLNRQGRERDGIVPAHEVDALLDEIAEGLATFTDLDGTPAVTSVERVADRFGSGDRAAPAARPGRPLERHAPPPGSTGVRSERYGTVQRHGVGSGRSGNHTEGDAWALVVPGDGRHADLSRPPQARGRGRHRRGPGRSPTDDLAGDPLLLP